MMGAPWPVGTGRVILCAVLAGATIILAAANVCVAGRMGHWTIKTEAGAVAQTKAEFQSVRGDLVHLSSDDESTATAESDPFEARMPYSCSWWFYVTREPYDDLVIYRARDADGDPTDVTVMLRELRAKVPEDPEEWRGALWVQDRDELQSVCHLRRPGWRLFSLVRKSEDEVELLIDREVVGTYAARSAQPAQRIELGDFSATDGAGKAYWGEMKISAASEGTGHEISPGHWRLAATGTGKAEQGSEFETVRRTHLYLRTDTESRCEAEWGTITVQMPYHFWCQVYVSEEPYQSFSVICPLGADGQPTDIQLIFDDEAGAADSEAAEQGFVWVTDAEGRHSVGSVTRGVWHDFAISRRSQREVALWIDGVPVKTFTARGRGPVASYRFGDFGSRSSRGEAYWSRIGLVPIPKH
jgi:hypothetical protein